VTLALVLGAAYLLGSIPSSYLVVRAFTGQDIRHLGSGNPGTMNVLDHVGLRPAVLVGAADIGKGAAAVWLAFQAGLDDGGVFLAGLLAVAGHVWPVFLRFRGGNGTGPTVGAIFAMLPAATLLSVVISFVVWRLIHSRRFAGLAGLLAVMPIAYALAEPQALIAGTAALVFLLFVRLWRVEGFAVA
jgi:glycerol-3-phosphate acyltransferase PlsY